MLFGHCNQNDLLLPNFRRLRVSLASKLAASFAMQVYAELFPGVQVDFCLNVRKSDWPPERIADVVNYLPAALTCHARRWRHMPVQQSTTKERCRRPFEMQFTLPGPPPLLAACRTQSSLLSCNRQ